MYLPELINLIFLETVQDKFDLFPWKGDISPFIAKS